MADCCDEFRAHQVRPNKCKNCFGDKWRHNAPTSAADSSAQASETDLSREQLLSELKRCQAEREDSARHNEQCRRDLEHLRSQLDLAKAASIPAEEATDKQVLHLREQLDTVRAERDQAREDLRLLESEMDEMHDNFKEEESEQFEKIKQELDGAVKDCKIFQIRLAKAERQYAQLEQVKVMLERQLAEKTAHQNDNPRALQAADEQPAGEGWIRVEASEYDQLLRELNDTSERERDLQEQIKFSQEEAQSKHERLQALELENELLMSKLAADMSREPSKQLEADQQLGLELAQSECQRLQVRLRELMVAVESKEAKLSESESIRARLESELDLLRSSSSDLAQLDSSSKSARLEKESRQLRAKLVRNERELRQLKAQLELNDSNRARGERQVSQVAKDTQTGQEEQDAPKCDGPQSRVEADLIEGLKRRLESSEAELVRARARLVELDLQCSRAQRQHKRLVESLASNTGELQLCRRVKLPDESSRDTMSRQDLRQALRALEQELVDCVQLLKSKDCLIRELQNGSPKPQGESASEREQSLRDLLEQECEASKLARQELDSPTKIHEDLEKRVRMLEHERRAMEEEVDKLRQVNGELHVGAERARHENETLERKLKDQQVSHKKIRTELAQAKSGLVRSESQEQATGKSDNLLLMARDLNELKAKNGFLMRELEMAREESANQLDELRRSQELQQRRAIELAQLELKDQHLVETQVLRDELNEVKQRLALSQRQVARANEEVGNERERLRALERDWRRDKSQFQQRTEQLEAQLAIERRSSDFKVKEVEANVRDKERQLLSLQESYVQLERDLKRLQTKSRMLEDESESRLQALGRELDSKKRELANQLESERAREEHQQETIRRLNAERATLSEALESVRRSYEEKSAEVRGLRQQMQVRQDQAYKERLSSQERIDSLASELAKAADREVQAKLQGQQLEMRERQLESMRRETVQLKEGASKLRIKCEELERRCQHYEKQELAAKTSSISPAAALFRSRAPSSQVGPSGAPSGKQVKQVNDGTGQLDAAMVDKLTAKVNDQRHLINMLRQQHEESQLELRQLQLLRTGERANWDSRMTLLTSRLAECEERLLFETSEHLSKDMTAEANRKLEARWADERRSTLETVRQQQSRCEQLVRDLKKLSQAHELLRHQARQLQAHSDKLSHKLIEMQQLGRRPASPEVSAQLACCEKERGRLERLMEEQARPMVSTVSKILAALDAAEKSSSAVGQPGTPASSGYASATQSTSRPLGVGSSRLTESESPEPNQVSRLSKLLGKQSKPAEHSDRAEKKTVLHKVRLKSGALGISATERRQLRAQLAQLKSALGDNDDQEQRTSLRLQDSDIDSDQSSLVKTDNYRRFPQYNPSSYAPAGASLTDYDSDLSLASGYAGAESDSGGQYSRAAKSRKRGLKTRITSTLRNLSRSITAGLASDSESEQASSRRRPTADLREISV